MQFGISTHLYHGARLDRDHLVEIAAHGFDAVEIFATRTHFDYHDRAHVTEIAGHASDAGLRVHSVHAPVATGLVDGVWGKSYSLATADAAARQAAIDETTAAIGAAGLLHASFVVTHLGVPLAQSPDVRDNRRDAVVQSLSRLSAAAGEAGVRLALEVLPNPISEAGALVALIEEELEAPEFGICLDTGHAFMMGDLVDAIESVSGHLVTTHVHDNHGNRDEHLVPFDGAIDWASTVMTLLKVGYEGTWMFELAATDSPRRVLERAQRARRRLEDVLGS
jgi:sugar phosphate isomerase/epimerase